MKISILTQPLGHNYGGLLQAYALQHYLLALGFTIETIDRQAPPRPLTHLKKFLKSALGYPVLLQKQRDFIFQNLLEFKKHRLSMSPCLRTEKSLRAYFQASNFDAAIVGSDQVWRPKYSPSLLNFYLDFLDDVHRPTKRISYAASFGVDTWEYTKKQTKACQELIRRFDAVSVREASGRTLCRTHFGIDAEWVLDPTLLLDAQTYNRLIPAELQPASNRGLLTYILDPANEKQIIASNVACELGTKLFTVKPKAQFSDTIDRNLSACIYPRVEEWLKGFKEADFVVTDSFHGCVFSIIYNKNFLAIGNSHRGLSRFHSLLALFGLENRLVTSHKDLSRDLIYAPIPWKAVNAVKEEKIAEARLFLLNNLSQ